MVPPRVLGNGPEKQCVRIAQGAPCLAQQGWGMDRSDDWSRTIPIHGDHVIIIVSVVPKQEIVKK